jgi:DNA recombination protein RmuC
MEMTIVIIVLVFMIAVQVVGVLMSRRKPVEVPVIPPAPLDFTPLITALSQQITNATTPLRDAQDAFKDSILKTLADNQQNVNSTLSSQARSSSEVLNRLNGQIGELQGAGQQMLSVGQEVRKLQDILGNPKMRGSLGEWSLKTILENVMPQGSFSMQYALKDGRIADAMVQLNGYQVAIDSKFPLPGFERLINASKEDAGALRRQFYKDVCIHINKIAESYIRPAENTADFALMYIPAENVYYEIMVKADNGESLLDYAHKKKVFPVSPNTLYGYLMTIVMGLHGLKIEKEAKEISQNLNKLSADFVALVSTWDTLGSQLRNAMNNYDKSGKQLDRFALQLETTTGRKIGA